MFCFYKLLHFYSRGRKKRQCFSQWWGADEMMEQRHLLSRLMEEHGLRVEERHQWQTLFLMSVCAFNVFPPLCLSGRMQRCSQSYIWWWVFLFFFHTSPFPPLSLLWCVVYMDPPQTHACYVKSSVFPAGLSVWLPHCSLSAATLNPTADNNTHFLLLSHLISLINKIVTVAFTLSQEVKKYK